MSRAPVLEDVSLRLDPDDRIALPGQNGNGKSTLAKLIGGKLEHFSGEMVLARKVAAWLFAQHHSD